MNDQSQMMNQAQMMAMSQAQAMSQPPPPMMSQPPPQMMSQIAQSSQPQPPQLMMMANQPQPPPPMMNRGGGYKVWLQQQQQQQPPLDPKMKFQNSLKPNYAGRNNWKGKKNTDKRPDQRRVENLAPNASMGGPNGSGGYKPPTLHELQSQNRLKARKFYPKKKYNNRFAPYAPRNTTSFIIRAKKSGGIASLVSPCPVTPAVLPTPIFSPSREVLGDMAKEEWGVDGYGSMKGLIRLRSPGNDDEEEEEGGGGSSESDVEEHVEVERRLDHDLSRFEMIYPNYSGTEYNNVLENRVDDQDSHIAQLEEENLTLKERLFLMEREMADMRRRLQFLERQNHVVGDVHEEVVENESENENESEGGSGAPDMCLSGKSSGQEGSKDVDTGSKKELVNGEHVTQGAADVSMEDSVQCQEVVGEQNDGKDEKDRIKSVGDAMASDKDVIRDEKVSTHEIQEEAEKDRLKSVGDAMAADKDVTRDEKVRALKNQEEAVESNDDGSIREEARTSS